MLQSFGVKDDESDSESVLKKNSVFTKSIQVNNFLMILDYSDLDGMEADVYTTRLSCSRY